ncbi:hypothetical protein CRG98_007295 [Punica granatum]|uniref:Reverse transcriptase zinc-binding domain-containing protein n=1 Tax=Punica granatum TaxID=22663 RepID=A0A2I0KV21_PUNGR|nr:hypothetical protein CRG98_007295 [Punica granatum]
MLPQSITFSLDRLNRDFWWGSSSEKRRMHLVNRDTVILPKADCGLGSANWKALRVELLAWDRGSKWAIDNGSRVNLWNDTWFDNRPLRDCIQGPLPQAETSRTVRTIISSSRSWDFNNIPFLCPPDIRKAITSIPLSSSTNHEDRFVWGLTNNGYFSTKIPYYALLNCPNLSPKAD